jgi:hypothetical protein
LIPANLAEECLCIDHSGFTPSSINESRSPYIEKVITQYKPRDYIQLTLGRDHQKGLGRGDYIDTPVL